MPKKRKTKKRSTVKRKTKKRSTVKRKTKKRSTVKRKTKKKINEIKKDQELIIKTKSEWIRKAFVNKSDYEKKYNRSIKKNDELTAINIDSYNYFYLGDVIFKFNRKENVNWNFGLAGIKFPGLNALFPNDIPFIPLPYFGYSRKF